jgi:hypothetical protein
MSYVHSLGSIYLSQMIWCRCIAFLFPIKSGIFSYFSRAEVFCSTFF